MPPHRSATRTPHREWVAGDSEALSAATQSPPRPLVPAPPRRPASPDDLDYGWFVPYEQRWSGPEDGRMPVAYGVPQLARIVPERWGLSPAPDVLARRAIAAGAPAVPATGVEGERRTRQVNVRIDPQDFRRLSAAAHILGMRPTALARVLILAGMRKVLADHGEHYALTAED